MPFITSRYANTCSRCGEPVEQGDRIWWEPDTPEVWHERCKEVADPFPSRAPEDPVFVSLADLSAKVDHLTELVQKQHHLIARLVTAMGQDGSHVRS